MVTIYSIIIIRYLIVNKAQLETETLTIPDQNLDEINILTRNEDQDLSIIVTRSILGEEDDVTVTVYLKVHFVCVEEGAPESGYVMEGDDTTETYEYPSTPPTMESDDLGYGFYEDP